MSGLTKFYFCAGDNELIETNVHLKPDCRSAIHGYVKDCSEKPIQDAAVFLFEIGGSEDESKLIAREFTDEFGQFIFGPLNCGQTYLIKVYKNMDKIRELIILPDPCDEPCEYNEPGAEAAPEDK